MKVDSKDPLAAAQEVDWGDFRDHLSTADRSGHRQWLYPKKPSGRFYRWRTRVSYLLLAILFVGPFVRINGNPLLLLNIVERRFSILGQIFWPQDGVIFALATLLFLTSIFVFTAAFGRLWCGWTCPQILLMEMVFRRIEYWIEGDASSQRRLNAAPWTGQKVIKKLAKHGIFFGLSFVIGNTLLSYITGSEQLIRISTDNPMRHLAGLGFMILFTLVFYAIFARFREQAALLSARTAASNRPLWTRTRWWSPTITNAANSARTCTAAKNRNIAGAKGTVTASSANSASGFARRALTSATARRWNVSIAPRASTLATRSWTRSTSLAALSATPPSTASSAEKLSGLHRG